MQIGDMVKYRSWKEGDVDPTSTPPERHGWDHIGLILEIGDWRLGSTFAAGESLIVYTLKGDFCEWRSTDASIISKTKNNSCDWKRTSGGCIDSSISNYQLRRFH